MGLLRYLPSKSLWKKSIISLKKGDSINKDSLVSNLISLGYINETTVTNTGEFASRGFILDIFPVNEDDAVRIEFWGDEIDSIRKFYISSQRSTDMLKNVEILPAHEFLLEDNINNSIWHYKLLTKAIFNRLLSVVTPTHCCCKPK